MTSKMIDSHGQVKNSSESFAAIAGICRRDGRLLCNWVGNSTNLLILWVFRPPVLGVPMRGTVEADDELGIYVTGFGSCWVKINDVSLTHYEISITHIKTMSDLVDLINGVRAELYKMAHETPMNGNVPSWL